MCFWLFPQLLWTPATILKPHHFESIPVGEDGLEIFRFCGCTTSGQTERRAADNGHDEFGRESWNLVGSLRRPPELGRESVPPDTTPQSHGPPRRLSSVLVHGKIYRDTPKFDIHVVQLNFKYKFRLFQKKIASLAAEITNKVTVHRSMTKAKMIASAVKPIGDDERS
jgi:hypothetical protein